MGCHGGLNDPGVLDLPQAYLQRKATYIGNTGFGWGGGGVVYSEALMRNLTRELAPRRQGGSWARLSAQPNSSTTAARRYLAPTTPRF